MQLHQSVTLLALYLLQCKAWHDDTYSNKLWCFAAHCDAFFGWGGGPHQAFFCIVLHLCWSHMVFFHFSGWPVQLATCTHVSCTCSCRSFSVGKSHSHSFFLWLTLCPPTCVDGPCTTPTAPLSWQPIIFLASSHVHSKSRAQSHASSRGQSPDRSHDTSCDISHDLLTQHWSRDMTSWSRRF